MRYQGPGGAHMFLSTPSNKGYMAMCQKLSVDPEQKKVAFAKKISASLRKSLQINGFLPQWPGDPFEGEVFDLEQSDLLIWAYKISPLSSMEAGGALQPIAEGTSSASQQPGPMPMDVTSTALDRSNAVMAWYVFQNRECVAPEK